MFGIKSPNP